MRVLITYLLIVSTITGFSQKTENACIPALAGESPATVCDKIKCLFENGKFVEAYSAVLILGNAACTENTHAMAIAKTLAANNHFAEALNTLEGIEKDPQHREEAQFEINRISRLKILSEQKSGTYIQNLISVNTEFNDLV